MRPRNLVGTWTKKQWKHLQIFTGSMLRRLFRPMRWLPFLLLSATRTTTEKATHTFLLMLKKPKRTNTGGRSILETDTYSSVRINLQNYRQTVLSSSMLNRKSWHIAMIFSGSTESICRPMSWCFPNLTDTLNHGATSTTKTLLGISECRMG